MTQPLDPQNSQTPLLAGVLDSSLDGIMAFDAVRNDTGRITDFAFTVVNKAAEQIVGRSATSLLGKHLLDELPGNKTDGLFDAYVRVVEDGEPFIAEHHYAHDGLNHWFRISATKCGDGFAVTFADITKIKATESDLRDTADRLTEAQELAKIGSWEWDCSTNKITWSDQAKRMFGIPVTQDAPDFDAHKKQIHPDDFPYWQSLIERSLSTHQSFMMSYRALLPDGTQRVVEAKGRCEVGPGDQVVRMFGTVQDITEKTETDQQVRVGRERFDLLVQGAAVGVWDWDCRTNDLYWSPRFKQILGYENNEIEPTYEDFVNRLHPDDKLATLTTLKRHLERHGPYNVEYRLRRKNGSYVWCHAVGQAQWNSVGVATRMAGSIADISKRKADEQELRKLSMVASRTEDGVVLTGADGRVEWANRAFTHITGYELDELRGKVPGRVLQGKDTDPQTVARIRDRMSRGEGFREILLNYRKSGDPYWIELEVKPIQEEDGQITHYMAIERDITQRIQQQEALDENQRRLQFALNGTQTGLWDWDVATGKTYFSDSWYTMLGYRPGTFPMHVQSWLNLVHPDDVERAKTALDAYFAGQTTRYTCEMRVKNDAGDWQWILDVGEAVERDEDGKVTRMIGLHLDIEQQKADQAELEAARDQARQASAAKSAFVANMSHEIRTPMNAILGYADLMLDLEQTEADKRNHAQTIRRNGKHLMGILNDVLDISKIEAGKMSIEKLPCTPDQLFADVITLMMPKAMQQGIDLDFEAVDPLPQRIVTDPTRVRQVLLNLVGNAIKFTKDGSVTVTVRNKAEDDGTILLTCEVTDTGIGIKPEELERLFKPFGQADDSTTRRFGGTGLGLAISHNLCELLGGSLTCTSTAGFGSQFTAKFRVGTAEQAEAKAANAIPRGAMMQTVPLTGRRVLVVEDGADNMRLIKHYLTKAGGIVEGVENGALGRDAALEAEQSGKPFDAVVMDMQMPVLDGYSATRELRDAMYERPIIALTAHASSEDRKKCIDAGCSEYLSKPVDRHQLVRMIVGQIELHALHDMQI